MRDYKGNTSRSSGPQRRRPAAVRKQPPKATRNLGGGGPRWLLAGLAAGLLVALLVFLNGREDSPQPDLRLSETEEAPARPAPPRPAPHADHPKPAQAKPDKDPEALALLEEPLPPPKPTAPVPAAPAAKPAPSTAETNAGKTDKPKTAKPEKRQPEEARYQFYDLLPSMEVEVPAEALDGTPAHPAASLAEGAAPHSDPAPIARLAPGEFFVIQAGSFRDPAEAQAMSAKLALRGLRTRVQPVTIPGQGKWYRLRSEPYHQAQEASEALQTARASGAQVMLIKAR